MNASFLDGVRAAYGRFGDEIYKSYLGLFAVLPIAIRTSNRVFLSHSMPNPAAMASFDPTGLARVDHEPADLLPGGLVFSMVWGRDTSPANVLAFLGKIDADWLVTGHIVCDQGFSIPNDRQIILDSSRSPAAYCLISSNDPLTFDDLKSSVKLL